MKITDVKVFPVDEEKLKAYATITFDNCFIVRDLKVISGNKGYFIAMPSKKRKDGTFRDVAHPLNSETRKQIEDAVLEVYEKTTAAGAPAAAYDTDEDYSPAPEPAPMSHEAPEAGAEEPPVREAEEPPVREAEEPPVREAEEPPAPDEAPETKGAEENPVIEPSEDPEKAFGYEE